LNINKDNLAFVFDFGGVLIDWDPRHLFRKFFNDDPQRMEDFLAEIGFTDWNLRQDQGYSFSKAVAELSERFPMYETLIRAYDARWEESLRGPILPSIEILGALKQAGYPLYGLSNWSAEKFSLVRPVYEFFDWFEMIMVSGEVNLVKPDPRIFSLFLEKAGLRAHDCIYIDDSFRNIETAQRMDFHTIWFQSAGQLRADLENLGIALEGGISHVRA
jgi:2-haloacid dehalogenase